MPNPYREQVSNVAALPVPKAGAALDVVARPESTYSGPAVDPLTQLGQALGGFVNPIARAAEAQDAQDKHLAAVEAKAKAAQESADKLKAGLVPTDNPNVPAAVVPYYLDKLKEASSERVGLMERDGFLNEFAQEYKKPDFNLTDFYAKYRSKALAGLTEPHMVGAIGASLDNAFGHAQAEYRSFAMQRATEESQSQYTAGLAEIGPSVSPETGFQIWKTAADAYVARGGTRSEAARFLLDHVNSISAKWPSPELYELFNQTDPTTGRTVAEMNPGLKDAIANAQKSAEQAQTHAFIKGTMATMADKKAALQRNLDSGAYANMSDSDLDAQFLPEVSETGLFTSPEAYAQFREKVFIQRQELIAQARQLQAVNAGRGWTLTHEDQKKRLNETAGPMVTTLSQTIDDPNQADASRKLIESIQNVVHIGKFDVAHDGLKSLIGSVKSSIPKTGEGPSPRFQRIAELYASMRSSTNPGLANQYFDEDTRLLFESYNHDTQNGQISNPSALTMAYALIDPARKAEADAKMKDPEFAKKVHDAARTSVVGLGTRLWRKLPFTGPAPETGYIEQDAAFEARKLIARGITNPDMIKDHLESYAKANYYFDPESNNVIKIPPALNNQSTQEAVTEWMKMVNKAQGDHGAQLVHMGGDRYQLALTKPTREIISSDISLNDIVQVHRAKTSMSAEELKGLAALNNKAIAGTMTGQDYTDNEQLIAKAKELGMVGTPLLRKITEARAQAATPVIPQIAQQMKQAAATPLRNLAPITPGDSDTGFLVKRLVAGGDHGAALTAMGEAVRLTAYKGPEGKSTIGIGYNLEDNAKNLSEDFRKAGIPAESIEAIKAGKMSITPDQAQRLYAAVRPRYEALAKGVIEKREAGAWDKMPSNARAVLTDMAYQLGGAGLDKYNSGLDKLLKGDFSGEGLAVSYTNRNTRIRTTDTRRHNLRLALLSSPTQFEALINHAQSKPANQFQYRIAAATQ